MTIRYCTGCGMGYDGAFHDCGIVARQMTTVPDPMVRIADALERIATSLEVSE